MWRCLIFLLGKGHLSAPGISLSGPSPHFPVEQDRAASHIRIFQWTGFSLQEGGLGVGENV